MLCDDGNLQNKYFLDALNLFYETQWIYNHPVTEILTKGILDNIPKDWIKTLQTLENEEFNDFVTTSIIKPEWPTSLGNFIQKCKNINKLPLGKSLPYYKLPKEFIKGLNLKKQHEIIHLAELVHTQCEIHGIKVIIDFGSGLGYICQLLHHLYNYKVLGLEENETNVNTARRRQKEMYSSSLQYVKYACYKLTDNSAELIQTILQNEFKEVDDVCLMGLHACGDLSIYVSKVFSIMKNARLLILMSCCYHKLSMFKDPTFTSNEAQYFHNFPTSRCLKKAIDITKYDISTFLRQPFLRLACQEPADRWYNMSEISHNIHAFHVLSRAVLELYAKQNNYFLEKRVRKATKRSQSVDIQTYVKNSLLRYAFKPLTEVSQVTGKSYSLNNLFQNEVHNYEIEKEIVKLWNKHCQKLKIVEIYTALQLILQASAESIILYDRLCWLQEQGFKTTIVPVMDKVLSPRCYAIVSKKN